MEWRVGGRQEGELEDECDFRKARDCQAAVGKVQSFLCGLDNFFCTPCYCMMYA